MKTICNLCLLFFVTISFSQQRLDSDGWTVFESKNTSKIIYISSTSGDDTTGKVYAPNTNEIGNDPFLPNGNIKPFKTIDQATKQFESGEAVWVLFKRGDVFKGELTLPHRNGESKDRPMLYGSYGVKKEMPLFEIAVSNKTVIRNRKDYKYVAIVGLSFDVPGRNPDDPKFEGFKNEAPSAFSLLCTTADCEISSLLIEGCVFRFFRGNSIQAQKDGVVNEVTLRRNVLTDMYSSGGHSQGLFTGLVNNFMLEENIFDHNGWYKQSYTGYNDREEGQATIFNHNTYFQNPTNVIFRNNSFYRPSSIGTKWTANDGPASGLNIEVSNNLFHDCEVGISLGGNKTEAPYRFKDVVVQGNVFNSGGLSRQTDRTLAWNMDIEDWDNGVFRENYIVHQNSDEIDNGIGIKIVGENRNLTIENNILYGLKKTQYLSIRNYDFMSTIIKGNDFSTVDTRSKHIDFGDKFPNGNIKFEDNKYLGQTPNIRVDSKTETLEEWSNISTEDVSKSIEQPDYKDPTRSLERYIKEELNLNSLDEFYLELRKQNIFNWRKAYTTQAINSWIKEGFEKNSLLHVTDYEKNKRETFLKYNYGDGTFEIISNVSDKVTCIEVVSLGGVVVKTIKNDVKFNTISDLSSGLYFFRFKKDTSQVLSVERYLKK